MAGRPHRLKGLYVNEISLVDAPANPGAVHLLFKRKDAPMPSESEIAAAAAKKAKDSGVLERLMTRLGLGKRDAAGVVDPDTYTDAASAAIDKACLALTESVTSIMADAAVTDKPAAVAKSMSDFRAFTADAAGEQIEKAMRDVALLTKSGKDDTVTDVEQIASLKKQLADAQMEVAVSKLSAKHAKHMAGLTTDAAKASFMAKSPEERDAACAGDDTNKLLDPATAVALTKAQTEIADLNKRILAFEADKEMAVFRKRAGDIGLAEAQAEMLLKASKGDETEFAKLLAVVKSATEAARTGGVFKEFGGSGGAGAGGEASAEVNSKAETLRKADPKLSLIQARVAVRKSDLPLAQRERDEERAMAGARV